MLKIMLLLSLFTLAQKTTPDSAKSDVESLTQQGNLFALKIVKGQPIKIFVVGKETAEIDLSKLEFSSDLDISNLSLSIRQTNPKPGKILKIKKMEKHFEIAEPIQLKTQTELEVEAIKNDKKEKFNIKLNGPK